MRIFISAGEPSGDLHGSNLVRALKRYDPSVECVGFGGVQMESAGCQLLYPLCRLAVMWFLRVFLKAPTFLRLLRQTENYFRKQRPDAVVLIDYPGFNWWVARYARRHNIPVFYFVPPQLWAWAGWRVRKMRRFVNHVLCNLPFEPSWYAARRVKAQFVGHPYFDELAQQRMDMDFLAEQQDRPGTVIALLPGSRDQEIERNLGTVLEAARRIHTVHPETRFLAACLRPDQRRRMEAAFRETGLPAEAWTGKMPEILHLAHSCIAVSGSVSLEILYHVRPAVVVYRIGWLDLKVSRLFITCPYISLVNMIAGEEMFPEFLTDRCEADAISRHIMHWLDDSGTYRELCGKLSALKARVALPGACDRAAQSIFEVLYRKARSRQAA